MKYFTQKLCDDINSDNAKLADKADKQWSKNCKEYWKYVQYIKPGMSKRLKQFFNYSMHDMEITSLHITEDRCHIDLNGQLWMIYKKKETEQNVNVLLTYKQIKDIQISENDRAPDIFPGRFLLGDWGYDEIECFYEYYKHNILTCTGIEISIMFRYFEMKII
jgi:hypothetical protein